MKELKEKNPWVKLEKKDQKLLDEGSRPMTAEEEGILKMNMMEAFEDKVPGSPRESRTVSPQDTLARPGGQGAQIQTDLEVQSFVKSDLEQKYNATFEDMLSTGTRKHYSKQLDELVKEESDVIEEMKKRGGSKAEKGRRDDQYTKLESRLEDIKGSQSQIQRILSKDEDAKKRVNTKYYERVVYDTEGRYTADMVPGMAQAAYAPIGMPTTLTPSLFPQAYAEEFQEQLQKDPKPLFDLGNIVSVKFWGV